jgi:hypothetical protein
MAFYPTHIRAFQEHFFILERRKIHESLNNNIFEKIAKCGLDGAYTSPIHRLKINYDLSTLRESSDYEEAKAHWEQDLKGIQTDPEKIESEINGLNQDIEKFFRENVRNYVVSAIASSQRIVNALHNVVVDQSPNSSCKIMLRWIFCFGCYVIDKFGAICTLVSWQRVRCYAFDCLIDFVVAFHFCKLME